MASLTLADGRALLYTREATDDEARHDHDLAIIPELLSRRNGERQPIDEATTRTIGALMHATADHLEQGEDAPRTVVVGLPGTHLAVEIEPLPMPWARLSG